MSDRILLYGATGYSGQLIAAEGQLMVERSGGAFSMVLAGRDGTALARLAKQLRMDFRVFCLDDPVAIANGLRQIAVVINAAGPFEATAVALARGAFLAGCHYVDINGEVDVYKKLEGFGRFAKRRNLAMICSAGHTAAASNLLLHAALRDIRARIPSSASATAANIDLGAVRIAMSHLTTLSRSSILTLLRSVRQQVTVVRLGEVNDGTGNTRQCPVSYHEPVGKIERIFNFGDEDDMRREPEYKKGPLRIGTAANLVDTLAARLSIARGAFTPHAIESYVEMGTLGRLGYSVGALFTPVLALPWTRELAALSVTTLPLGPTPQERAMERHRIVLEIEDPLQRSLVGWRWHTPNPYDFTARVVVEIGRRVVSSASTLSGWLTPAEVLSPSTSNLTSPASAEDYLRGCSLDTSLASNNLSEDAR